MDFVAYLVRVRQDLIVPASYPEQNLKLSFDYSSFNSSVILQRSKLCLLFLPVICNSLKISFQFVKHSTIPTFLLYEMVVKFLPAALTVHIKARPWKTGRYVVASWFVRGTKRLSILLLQISEFCNYFNMCLKLYRFQRQLCFTFYLGMLVYLSPSVRR